MGTILTATAVGLVIEGAASGSARRARSWRSGRATLGVSWFSLCELEISIMHAAPSVALSFVWSTAGSLG